MIDEVGLAVFKTDQTPGHSILSVADWVFLKSAIDRRVPGLPASPKGITFRASAANQNKETERQGYATET